MKVILLLGVLLSLIDALPSFAAVLNVPTDYPTIQDAVDAAAVSGDTIMIAPGTYLEDVVVLLKGVDIRGSGAANTFVQSLRWSYPDNWTAMNDALSDIRVLGSISGDGGVYWLSILSSIIDGSSTFGQGSDGVCIWANDSVFIGPFDAAFGWGDPWNWGGVGGCEFYHGVSVSGAGFSAGNCVFHEGARVDIYTGFYGDVTGCTFAGGGSIFVHTLGSVTIMDNICSGGAIEAEGQGLTIENNVGVRSIWMSADCGTHSIAGNTVVGGTIDVWIWGHCSGTSIHGNVVVSGDAGIVSHGDEATIENNTIYGSSGTGIRVTYDEVNEVIVQRNLVVGNHLGMDLGSVSDPSQVACNDVFNNTGGNWLGENFEGVNGNFALDPLFCAVEDGDFTLADNSPCLPGNGACGLVGARDVGCASQGACCYPDETCALSSEAECVEVGTYLGDGVMCEPNPCPRTGACCLHAYCARLSAADCASYGGTYEGDGTLCEPNPCPTSAVEDAVGGLELSIRATPNPSTGAIMIEYAVPRATTVTIEIFDVGGTLVRRLSEGLRLAGSHQLRWDGTTQSGLLAPSGVYFARAVTREGTAANRVILTQSGE